MMKILGFVLEFFISCVTDLLRDSNKESMRFWKNSTEILILTLGEQLIKLGLRLQKEPGMYYDIQY